MSKIKLFLLDDHKMLNEGLSNILAKNLTLQIMGTFTAGLDLLNALNFEKPDIVLCDISMPDMDGLEVTKRIKAVDKNILVLIFTMHNEYNYMKEAINAGADGYLLKDCENGELLEALHTLMRGEKYLSPTMKKNKLDEPSLSSLTKREIEVLNKMAMGLTTKEIADKINLSAFTIETHRKNLLSKSGSTNVASLVLWGVNNGFIK